jgi:hypothetical protein
MRKLVVNCETGAAEYVDLTPGEVAQAETLAATPDPESPPSLDERVAAIEAAIEGIA